MSVVRSCPALRPRPPQDCRSPQGKHVRPRKHRRQRAATASPPPVRRSPRRAEEQPATQPLSPHGRARLSQILRSPVAAGQDLPPSAPVSWRPAVDPRRPAPASPAEHHEPPERCSFIAQLGLLRNRPAMGPLRKGETPLRITVDSLHILWYHNKCAGEWVRPSTRTGLSKAYFCLSQLGTGRCEEAGQ